MFVFIYHYVFGNVLHLNVNSLKVHELKVDNLLRVYIYAQLRSGICDTTDVGTFK